MKTKTLPALVAAFTLGIAAVSASAQTPPPSTTPVIPPDLARTLGPQIQALIAANRDAAKTLLEQRSAALQALKTATPAQRDAIIANLQDMMKNVTAEQKELAKAIRDAIKARRDQARAGG